MNINSTEQTEVSQGKHITQAAYIKALQQATAQNSYGLPEGIYRADLLPALPTNAPPISKIQFQDIHALGSQAQNSIQDPEFETPTTDIASLDAISPNARYSMQIPMLMGDSKFSPVAKAVGLPRHALDAFEEDIDAAFVSLDYTEGFPTIASKPFWMQLAFEPPSAYINFEQYLRQADIKGIRQLHLLESDHNSSADLLEEYSLYYWAERAKAFDTFNIIHRRRERERQALTVENQHLMMGNRLFDICESYLTANASELEETLSPKNFVEMLKMATTLQRISVGLPANGPSPASAEHPITGEGKSIEVTLRQIAASNQVPATNNGQSSAQAEKEAQQNVLRSLLSDPDSLNLAQELIVRVNKQ